MLRLQHRCLRCLPGIDYTLSGGGLDEVKSGVYRLTFRGCICAPAAPVAQFTSIKMLTQTKNPLTKEVGMAVKLAVATTIVEQGTSRLIYLLLCQKILILPEVLLKYDCVCIHLDMHSAGPYDY